jgi:hypothetical protein
MDRRLYRDLRSSAGWAAAIFAWEAETVATRETTQTCRCGGDHICHPDGHFWSIRRRVFCPTIRCCVPGSGIDIAEVLVAKGEDGRRRRYRPVRSDNRPTQTARQRSLPARGKFDSSNLLERGIRPTAWHRPARPAGE